MECTYLVLGTASHRDPLGEVAGVRLSVLGMQGHEGGGSFCGGAVGGGMTIRAEHTTPYFWPEMLAG